MLDSLHGHAELDCRRKCPTTYLDMLDCNVGQYCRTAYMVMLNWIVGENVGQPAWSCWTVMSDNTVGQPTWRLAQVYGQLSSLNRT